MMRLIIAGAGSAERELRALVRRLRLEHRVEFYGRVDEVTKRALYRNASLHVLMSDREGWGLTVFEAAGAAVPTVAADAPGLREAVVHGETGLLVRRGDIRALRLTLQLVARNEGLRRRLGADARRRAEASTWDNTAQMTETHLHGVLLSAAASAA